MLSMRVFQRNEYSCPTFSPQRRRKQKDNAHGECNVPGAVYIFVVSSCLEECKQDCTSYGNQCTRQHTEVAPFSWEAFPFKVTLSALSEQK